MICKSKDRQIPGSYIDLLVAPLRRESLGSLQYEDTAESLHEKVTAQSGNDKGVGEDSYTGLGYDSHVP